MLDSSCVPLCPKHTQGEHLSKYLLVVINTCLGHQDAISWSETVIYGGVCHLGNLRSAKGKLNTRRISVVYYETN